MITKEVNTYSAGSITDLMPQGMYEMLENVMILTNNPTGERLQEYHGGMEFDITINNRTLHWKVIHNFNDYFDLTLIPEDSNGQIDSRLSQVEHNIGNGDLKNVFDTLWADYIAFKEMQVNKGKEIINYILTNLEEE
tara:strand:- start:844 stop:1254 length:411 start_codon:yes stop_codon:yes gene_type:complete